MGVVKGDRIGDSEKLSGCRPDEQDAYARMVATLPDAFGRFRVSLTQIAAAMYPRMDDPRRIGRAAARWKKFLALFESHGLLRFWEADSITWAEVVGWKASARNAVHHRTSEPPWSDHVHTEVCLPTAISCHRRIKDGPTSDALSSGLIALRVARAQRKASGGVAQGGVPSVTSVPSVSSVSSVPTEEQRTTNPDPPSLALVPPPDTRTKADRKAAKPTADRPETRALCDAQARVTARAPTYSAAMLEAFARLLDAGRTSSEVERVLVAYRDKATSAAVFARDGQGGGKGGPGLQWALRPGDAGGFDKILMQLDDGGAAPLSGSVYEGSAARLRARMEATGNGER